MFGLVRESEPGISRTRNANHTTRPTSQLTIFGAVLSRRVLVPPIAQLVERRTVVRFVAGILRSLVQIRLGGMTLIALCELGLRTCQENVGVRSGIRTHAHYCGPECSWNRKDVESWVWRLRPLGHPDKWIRCRNSAYILWRTGASIPVPLAC